MEIFLENTKEKMDFPGQNLQDFRAFSQAKLKFSPYSALVNGVLTDWQKPLEVGDKVNFVDFQDKKGKECFWHSSAHILAQAISRLYPAAKPTIGPPIEQGFYYDFADLEFSEKDFAVVENEMQKVVKEDLAITREEIVSMAEAKKLFANNPFKIELIEEFQENLSLYRQGDWFDLCRGPHVPSTGVVKAVKILKTAGAYWRGDSKKPQLTRIYAISFPTQEELKTYLRLLEESKKRDHRVLGAQLDLFSFHDESPGMPFIHPKGTIVWEELISYWRKLHMEEGYQELKTPQMLKKDLWEVSGHWANYQNNMYTSKVDEEDYAIKPMNCPGACVYYKSTKHSYRDLPLRLSEIGHVHRHELSGALSGLFRVRSFHQDDAHLFLKLSDIRKEVENLVKLSEKIYTTFGLEYHFELSTRPEKSIGSEEMWKFSTQALRDVLEGLGQKFQVNEGDGAFYGPKIDTHVRDALGRFWQTGTIQLDVNFPERFDLSYTNSENQEERPIMLHNAIYGSIERFLGILIEHFAGRFPLWLSPEQIVLLPITSHQESYAEKLARNFIAEGWRVRVDNSSESLNKKIRAAQLKQANYMLIVGEKEVTSQTFAARLRTGENLEALTLESFLPQITHENRSRALHSPFAKKE